ncbi:hypothetical protein K9K77_03005 [Candidatus Babeliales bacterium]|nr:hypothetical protein [Candidatus Babeliales bacterium]
MKYIFFGNFFLLIGCVQAAQEARLMNESPIDFSVVRVLQYPDNKIIIHVKNERDGTDERMDTPPGFFDTITFDRLTSEELVECVATLQKEISEKESELQKFKVMQQAGQTKEVKVSPALSSVEHYVRQAIDEYQGERQAMCTQLVSMRIQLRSSKVPHPAQTIIPKKSAEQELMDALQEKFKNVSPGYEDDKSVNDDSDF